MIAKALLEKVITGHRNERVYLCEQEFALFAMYYFAEYFTYAIPGFQWMMYKALNEFIRGRFKFLLWIMFRESAKTTIAKVYVIYCICYQKKRFINYDSYDKGNAESALFDISTWLQTNKRLIQDFGQLYFESIKARSQEQKMKRLTEFVTANKVKVKAYSTQESTRGRIYDRWRPDLYIIDDFETEVTAKSLPVTAKIIAHLDGLKAGLSPDGQVIFLGNLISETGSVASLMMEAQENPNSWRSMRVDVEMDGAIVWPDKYVKTNAEANEINAKIPDRKQWKVSLEQKKKDLNAGGRKVYEAEMMNNPEAAGEPFFERSRVDRDIALAKMKQPIKVVGGLSVWEEYRAKSRYAFGGDTAKGVSRDSCASVGIRFADVSSEPSVVIGSYASNTIPPDDFGDEMASHGRMFGECLLAPELNNTGYATVTRLKSTDSRTKLPVYPVHRIYRQVREDQIGKNITRDLGWEATSANVATIYFNFRSAYQNGELKIYCPYLLAEIRAFTKRDLEESSKRTEQPQGVTMMTRHFDRLRAACIAWDMRMHATISPPKKSYKQLPHVPVSDYQGQ